MNGTSDPIVKVDLMGQQRYTRVKFGVMSAVFDETFIFQFKELTIEDVEGAECRFTVCDHERLRRNQTIGSFQVDISSVYLSNPDHEVYRQWVVLANDSSKRSKGGTGFLKMSVTVMGPDDKPKVHDLAAELEAEEKTSMNDSIILTPPNLTSRLNFLVLTIYQGTDLPALDGNLGILGGTPGIDAYVRVLFASNPKFRTSIKMSEARAA